MRREEQSRGWFQRNWGWCIGCGCLLPLLAIGGMAVGTWWLATEWFDSNEATATAMALVNADPRAVAALGTPIEARFLGDDVSFNFTANRRLRANFTVSGPEGQGRIELEAHVDGADGPWLIDRLLLYPDGHDGLIDLLDDRPSTNDSVRADSTDG